MHTATYTAPFVVEYNIDDYINSLLYTIMVTTTHTQTLLSTNTCTAFYRLSVDEYVYVIWMWIDWYRKYQPAVFPQTYKYRCIRVYVWFKDDKHVVWMWIWLILKIISLLDRQTSYSGSTGWYFRYQNIPFIITVNDGCYNVTWWTFNQNKIVQGQWLK
jgi:hypothetical protein